MKEWILYCVLCSLIYAMSAQGTTVPTADVVYWNNARLPVTDCAIFIPAFDQTLGPNATYDISQALRSKGYAPTGTFSLHIHETSQADSAGHRVSEYYTDRDTKNLNRLGRNSLYLTLTGLKSTIKKKHKFTLRLHTIGRTKHIASTIRAGTIGQTELNIADLPNCQPKDMQK